MMTKFTWRTAYAAPCVLVLLARLAAAAEAEGFSGFLTDYSQLEPVSSVQYADYIYLAPHVYERTADYVGVVIPQPLIFISANSKYQGIKPDDVKVLADAFREVLISELRDSIPVTTTAGPGILELQIAMSNVYLRKPKRSPAGYLPIALVVSGARQALLNDITKKIDLTGLTIEAQLMDSVNLERFGAYIDREGARKQTKDFASWDELEVVLRVAGRRLACRYQNSRWPADQRQDCLAITAADLNESENPAATFNEILSECHRAYREDGLSGAAPYRRSRTKSYSTAGALIAATESMSFIEDRFPEFHDALRSFPQADAPNVQHRFFAIE